VPEEKWVNLISLQQRTLKSRDGAKISKKHAVIWAAAKAREGWGVEVIIMTWGARNLVNGRPAIYSTSGVNQSRLWKSATNE